MSISTVHSLAYLVDLLLQDLEVAVHAGYAVVEADRVLL
jgi:hypothetical protein